MEEKKIQHISQIPGIKIAEVYSSSVVVYGGNEGGGNSIRIAITLYDITGNIAAFLKFYSDESKIEKDCFKDGFIYVNLPLVSYHAVLTTVRSPLRVQVVFNPAKESAMLLEMCEPKIMPAPPVDSKKVN